MPDTYDINMFDEEIYSRNNNLSEDEDDYFDEDFYRTDEDR